MTLLTKNSFLDEIRKQYVMRHRVTAEPMLRPTASLSLSSENHRDANQRTTKGHHRKTCRPRP